ncbi:hypothetical protein Aperf_G00000020823 [Anoplocephala perfoliata]
MELFDLAERHHAELNPLNVTSLEYPMVNVIVSELLKNFESCSKEGPFRRKTAVLKNSSIRLVNSARMPKLRQPRQDPSPDILKRHSCLFTEEREFCPRTLKSAAHSRIRNLDCYNPPKQCSSHLSFDAYGAGRSDMALHRKFPISNDIKALPASENQNLQPSIRKTHKKSKSAKKYAGHFSTCSERDVDFLKFSTSITNDILQNKQFSNSDLIAIFQSHLEHSDSKLSREGRLKAIRQIGEQLIVPPELIAKLSSTMSQTKSYNPVSAASVEKVPKEVVSDVINGKNVDSKNELTSSPSSLKQGGDKTYSIESDPERQSRMSESTEPASVKSKPPSNRPLALPLETDGISDISDSDTSVRKVRRRLSSLELRRTTDQRRQGANYDDDFENTIDKEDGEIDVGYDDIGSLEEDYSDDSFEDDDSDE